MSQPNTPGPPAPTVWPSVGFTDVDAGVRFLTEGLGFVVTAMYRDGAGTVEHAEARWPDGGGVMFGSRGKPGPWGALGPQGVYVVAADAGTVHAAWDRVRTMDGIEVLQELHDTDYGSHQFGVRDADGNLWTIEPTAARDPGPSSRLRAERGSLPPDPGGTIRKGWVGRAPPGRRPAATRVLSSY